MDPREMDPYQILHGLPPQPPILVSPAQPQPLQQATMSSQGTIVHPGQQEEHDELEGRDESMHQLNSADVFSSYENRSLLPGSKPHPGDIVEAAPLAALPLPAPTYPLADSIPSELVTSAKLSSLQLEGVLYACQRHQAVLASGQRAGFFLGDGAGVGKGRQISAIILDNFSRGRKRHIWFSISADLIVDARRDLTDLGVYLKVIEGCQQLDKETRVFGLPKDFKEGVIFSTYATLVSAVNKTGAFSTGKQSRLQQLIDWCGGVEFDGCLVFDECHKAKNFVPGRETASTKVALAVSAIQRLLPKARVLYCSATGVTDIKNMAFMERLGLWGEGTAFKSFEQLYETVRKKGLGVAEMLAMEMKTSGMYVSRGLSFKQTEFGTEEVELTAEQTKMYNTAANVWNELRKSLTHALERTCSSNNRVWSSFWASHQRFFKQLCMATKVPYIVSETKKAIEDGFCVVIGLQTTGEASLEAEFSRQDVPRNGFVSLCREILTRFIRTHFPTVIEAQNQAGLEDEWSATAKKMLLEFAAKIKLPDSPLDEIIDKLGGPESVAEMTGRKARVARKHGVGTPAYELRAMGDVGGGADSMDSLNVQERNAFMEGKKLVAIISDAASTGISLHADVRCGNQCRRVHITMELPWSADKAVQQLGRSHRSNQTSGPIYKLLTTNLGGERRFAAAVAKRLQSLGALTKGDRRAATGADLTEFNFDTPYGRHALRSMYSAICSNTIVPGVAASEVTRGAAADFYTCNTAMKQSLGDMGILEEATLTTLTKVKDNIASDVGRFLNRILGLKVEQQNQMFHYFMLCLENQTAMAKREGRYNEGLVDIQASSLKLAAPPTQVFKAKCTANNPTKHVVVTVDRGMSWEQAVERLKNNPEEDNGFYVSKRESRRGKLYLLATRKQGSKHLFRLARPNTGLSGFDEEQHDLFHKYQPISPEEAEDGWRQLYDSNSCMHGPACKAFPACSVGSRCYDLHLLCGGILTLMDILEITIMKFAQKMQFTKTEMTLRVVRAQLDSGERVLGVRYPQVLIQHAETYMRETMASSENPASAVLVHTEPPATVVPRLLAKACTPPVTIRNFFKPVETSAKGDGKTDPKSKPAKQKATDAKPKSTAREDFFKRTKRVEETEASAETKEESGEMGVIVIEPEGAKSLANGSNTHDKAHDTVQNAAKLEDAMTKQNFEHGMPKEDVVILEQENVMTNNNDPVTSDTRGLKRPSGDSIGSSSKKRKQDGIQNMFAKQVKKQETRSCPICGLQFKATALNVEINTHIDNCLIE